MTRQGDAQASVSHETATVFGTPEMDALFFRTTGEADVMRAQAGPRQSGRNQHYDICSGPWCPCFMEGRAVAAARHLDILDHFARVSPDLVLERLREHRPISWDGFRPLDCESCGQPWPCSEERERAAQFARTDR